MSVTIIDKDRRTVDESKDKDFTPQEIDCLDRMERGRNEVVGKMKFDRGVGSSIGVGLKNGVTARFVNGRWVDTRLGRQVQEARER